MAKKIEMRIQCPECEQFRTVKGDKREYPDGKRLCRSCARKLQTAGGFKLGNGKEYRGWDHDPWKVIKAECVVANQLHDGWTGTTWI